MTSSRGVTLPAPHQRGVMHKIYANKVLIGLQVHEIHVIQIWSTLKQEFLKIFIPKTMEMPKPTSF